MKRSLMLSVLAGALCAINPGPAAHAASNTTVWRGNGWTLTVTYVKSSYGETYRGSLAHAGKRYHMEGDWIPAADEGSYLFRFYGHVYGPVHGLISVAVLGNACRPSCAASSTYMLAPLPDWNLPELSSHRSISLKAQQ